MASRETLVKAKVVKGRCRSRRLYCFLNGKYNSAYVQKHKTMLAQYEIRVLQNGKVFDRDSARTLSEARRLVRIMANEHAFPGKTKMSIVIMD